MSYVIRLLYIASLLLHFLLESAASLHAAEGTSTEIFEKHIRPALIEHCVRCHGAKKQQGGLRLDSREGWARGGDSGIALAAGDMNSLLLEAIRYEDGGFEMPPKGKLPDATIRAFERWIELGAVDPRNGDQSETHEKPAPTIEKGRAFWSFQPCDAPPIPDVEDKKWAKTKIDRFILARLESEGLSPTEDASKHALLRRLSFDLTGLPPTRDQIETYLSDDSPDAYERLVDRLLKSQHFGERWGRHWLDVVRFAESSGGGRTLLFPNAWRYRDYVIEAFNEDVPYDTFLRQQIAGDLLDTTDWRERRRNLIATAFLLLGPTNYEMQDKDILEMDVVDEQLDTIGKSLMGMTIGCARCHDHKFDPIPTRDYYAMAGILKSTHSLVHSNVSKWNTIGLPFSPEKESAFAEQKKQLSDLKASHKSALTAYQNAGGGKSNAATSVAADELAGIVVDESDAEKEGAWTESTSIAKFVGKHYIHDGTENKGNKRVVYRPRLTQPGRYEVLISYSATNNRSTRVPVQISHASGTSTIKVNQRLKPDVGGLLKSLGSFEFNVDDDCFVSISTEGTDDGVVIADAIVFSKDSGSKFVDQPSDARHKKNLVNLKTKVDQLASEIETFERSMLQRPVAMATKDIPNPNDIPLAIRGVAAQKGPIIPRGWMRVAHWESEPSVLPSKQSGRLQLAEWITDARHPLTARVMVNRIWYWMMGRGIVPSVDNFGNMGERPTHPELLDYLATSFTNNGWSIKDLVREIAVSRTYRLATTTHATGLKQDSPNRYYWRRNRKRLRAEDIRDAMLMVSGNLDKTLGGPGIKDGTKIEYGYSFSSNRRSVYLPVFRNALPEVFEVFDFADPNIQRGARANSTVASQALWMMNHPFVIEQARQAASRAQIDGLPNSEQLAADAYLQVLGRPPTMGELDIARDLWMIGDRDAVENSERLGLLYQTLFQCIDFRYLD